MPKGRYTRSILGYVALLSVAAALIGFSLWKGARLQPVLDVRGTYVASELHDACLGDGFELTQSGRFVLVKPLPSLGTPTGNLNLDGTTMAGTISCVDGASGTIRMTQEASGLRVEPSGEIYRVAPVAGTMSNTGEAPLGPEKLLGRLMLAIAVAIVAARAGGALIVKIGQPRVMGEVLAGILLGPTLLGAVAPGAAGYLFPAQVEALLTALADVGLVFYMFLIGLELDPGLLKGKAEQAAFISHASIAVPMATGMLLALVLFPIVGPPGSYAPFAIFIGVAMSITAFPVLARILLERRMLAHPVGALAIGSAAVDDVTAWMLLALATGVASSTTGNAGGVGLEVGMVVLLTSALVVVVFVPVRRVFARVSRAYDEAGHVPSTWLASIFIGVLLAAFVATSIPVAGIFGAFIVGLAMPRRAEINHEIRRRIEDFVVILLLPLFFVISGQRVEIGLLNDPALWLLTGIIVLVAIVGKWAGAAGAARYTGLDKQSAAAIGALMNTRGLTELIVLSLGLALGVITPALFTMLVIMALATTFMTGPILRLIDPRGRFSSTVSEGLSEATNRDVMTRAVLVAPQDLKNVASLLSLATLVASSEPRRELLLVGAVPPSRDAAALARDEHRLTETARRLQSAADGIDTVPVRTTVFTSPSPGEDLVRLASDQPIDLVILDGRRPLLRPGPPGGEVGRVLEHAVCDVAVVVDRRAKLELGPSRPVIVPFGGGEHDWAAVEFGTWVAARGGAPLVLIGSTGGSGRDASRLLADVSLVVQRLTGVTVEPRIAVAGQDGILAAAEDGGLLVVGLSDRWRTEGLGDVRRALASSVAAPTVFVRRGTRPGALASRNDVTRFSWSRVTPDGPPRGAAPQEP